MDRQTVYPYRGSKNRRAAFSSQVRQAGVRLRMLVLLVAILSCAACGLPAQPVGLTSSPANPGPNQTVTPQPGITPSSKAPAAANLSDVKAVASQVYDQVLAKQDLQPLLGGIFEGLGIPVLSESTDGKNGVAMIKAGKPAIFDAQLDMIGQGYANGMAVNLDSFLADLTDHGAKDASTSGPVTSATLKDAMTSLVGKTSYAPQETLPGLVIALGQERARRLNLATPDPLWGDGWLDPLQYALLAYGFAFPGIHTAAGVNPTNPAVNSGIITWVKSEVGQATPGFFDNLMNGLNPLNVPDYILCGLYYINNSRLILSGPASVYHKQPDVTSPPPYQATINGTLFLSVPSPRQRDLLNLAGCQTPPNAGTFPGKTIRWSLDSLAQQHGSYANMETTTKADGTVSATYQTIDETTQQAGRIPLALQKVSASLTAEATDLVPSHPQLEAGGRLLGSGVSNTYPLEIRFYANLALDIGGTYKIPGKDTTVTNVLANQTIPLTGSNGTLQRAASLPISSSATWTCGSGGTVQAKGAFTGKFQVIATPGSGANNDQLSFSFVPDLSMLKSPVANTQCAAGDLNDVAWAALVSMVTAKFTLSSSMPTYDFTPPKATGKITFTLHLLKP